MMAAKRHKEHRLENGCRNGVGGSRSFSMPRFYLLTTAIVMPSLTWAADDLPRKYCLLLDRPKLAELQNIGSDLELPDLEITFEKYSRVDRSGWTWVSGGWDGTTHQRGYMVSPDGKFRHDMPEVFQEDCSYGSWLSGRCRPSLSTFSPAARVAFIAGSLRTANGDSAPKSYAIFGSTEVELPTNARGKTKHVGDIPELGLAILSGPSNELILFSSEIVAIYDLSLLNAANDQPVNWRSISTYDNRTLIVGGEFVLNHAIFVYEILPGPSLKAIPVPIRRGGAISQCAFWSCQWIPSCGPLQRTVCGQSGMANFTKLCLSRRRLMQHI